MSGPLDAYQGDQGYAPGFMPAAEPHPKDSFGWALSLARHSASQALPTAAGIAVFPAGAAAGALTAAPLDPFTFGGASVVGGLIGGTAAAITAGGVTSTAQRPLLNRVPGLDESTLAHDQVEHPIASFIGDIAPQAAFLRPGFAGWRAAATGAAIAGSVEAGSEATQGGGVDLSRIDLTRVGLQSAAGALLNHETRLGQLTGAAGKVAASSTLRAVAAIPRFATRTVDTSLAHLPEPMRAAAVAASVRAGTVPDRALTVEVRRTLAPYSEVDDQSTPDEKAALHIVDRDADVREASPLHPDPASIGEHDNRLATMQAFLGITGKTADIPSPAPLPATPTGGDLTTATLRAEGTGKNPNSSAEGYGQFLRSTWLDVYRRNFGAADMTDAQVLALRNDPKVGAAMTAAYAGENAAGLRRSGLEDSPGNLSLAHFLGLGGARDLLRASPDAPVESLLPEKVITANERVLRGKTAADVIAWAHKRIGNASGQAVARADAVPQWDFATDAVPDDAPSMQTVSFKPDEIETDAPLMQYKSGGDESGVTDRLRNVDEWNPIYSGKSVVWQDEAGRNVIVDGHQRLGLAKRLYADDPSIRLDAMVLREADGVTAQQARSIGALKNIAEGSGDAIDAARVLRDAPAGADLPRIGNTLAAQGHGLASLSNDAFGAVLNNVVDPAHAARIGHILPDQPERHGAMVKLLYEAKPRSAAEAEAIVRQATADGFGAPRETQLGMFGDEPQASLYGPAARVLEAAKRRLKSEKRTFSTLTENAGRIENAGNVLDREANQAKVSGNDKAIAFLDAAAHTSGPVRTALLDAARRSLDGDHTVAVAQFLDAIDRLTPQDVAGNVGEGAGARELPEHGRFSFGDPQADRELASGRELSRGTSPYEDALSAEQHGLAFSDPSGSGGIAQSRSIEHDLLMDKTDGTFRLSDDGDERTFADLMKSANADLAAVEKARACLAPVAPEGSDGA